MAKINGIENYELKVNSIVKRLIDLKTHEDLIHASKIDELFGNFIGNEK